MLVGDRYQILVSHQVNIMTFLAACLIWTMLGQALSHCVPGVQIRELDSFQQVGMLPVLIAGVTRANRGAIPVLSRGQYFVRLLRFCLSLFVYLQFSTYACKITYMYV